MPSSSEPIVIALIDDYDVVLAGIANMLAPYQERVRIAEIDANKPLRTAVDIALLDSFAQGPSRGEDIEVLINNPLARRVAVYTWNFAPALIDEAIGQGVHGYLSKALPARQLVAELEAIHAGEQTVSQSPHRAARMSVALDWPGRREGLSDREGEVLALITQGKSNVEIAESMFLSANTVKSYIRSIYRKIDVTSRTQAVVWGVRNGFLPDHHRIETWRG